MKNYIIYTSTLVSLLFFMGVVQAISICPEDVDSLGGMQQIINDEPDGGEIVFSSSCVGGREFFLGDGIDVNKKLTLRSASQTEQAILWSNGRTAPVLISADGIDIRSLKIKYNGTEGQTAALRISGANNITVWNSTIFNEGEGEDAVGIEMIGCTGNNVTGNNITVSGTTSSGNRALLLKDCSDSVVRGNNMTVYGDSYNWALAIIRDSTGSNYNLIEDNTIYVVGSDTGNEGVHVSSSSYNIFRSNNVSGIGFSDGSGFSIDSSNHTILSSNEIFFQAINDQNSGLKISNSLNATLESNSLKASSSGSEISALSLEDTFESRIYGNNIESTGTSGVRGLELISNVGGSNNNLIDNNNITVTASEGYGIVFRGSTGNIIHRSSIHADTVTDIGNTGAAVGRLENFIIDSQFDKQDIEFEVGTDIKMFVQYNVSFIVTDVLSNVLEGVKLKVYGTWTGATSPNPTHNATLRTNSTGVANALLTEFMADVDHQQGNYIYFTNYTVIPGIGINRTTQVNASSTQTVDVKIEADSVSIHPSLSTTNNSLKIDAPSPRASLEITTTGPVSGATVLIANHSQNPAASSALGVTELGKYLQIEVSDDISSSLSWAIIKVNYTDAELAEANIDESSLKIYHYNESSGLWEAFDSPFGGVNTNDNFVWANTTHFSTFGVFGSQISSTPAPIASSGGGGRAPSQTQQIVNQTSSAPIPTVSETEEPVSATNQAGEAVVESAGTPGTTPVSPVFNPPSSQPAGNPITGLFAFGQGGSPLTGMVFAADGSPNPVFFLGLVAVSLAGSIVYMKRRLIFRHGKNRKYGEEGEQAGVAATDSEGEDRDTPQSGRIPGQVNEEGGEEQAVHRAREEDRN
jgi:hypothetical protein